MDTRDETTKRQIADFENHLQEMYRYQQQALLYGAMQRVLHDVQGLQSPPQSIQSPASLISRFGRWLQQQRFPLPFEDLAREQRIDAEIATDPIIIIDASYTVVNADPKSAPVVSKEEEDAEDTTPAGQCTRCQAGSRAERGQYTTDSQDNGEQHDAAGQSSSVRDPQVLDDDPKRRATRKVRPSRGDADASQASYLAPDDSDLSSEHTDN